MRVRMGLGSGAGAVEWDGGLERCSALRSPGLGPGLGSGAGAVPGAAQGGQGRCLGPGGTRRRRCRSRPGPIVWARRRRDGSGGRRSHGRAAEPARPWPPHRHRHRPRGPGWRCWPPPCSAPRVSAAAPAPAPAPAAPSRGPHPIAGDPRRPAWIRSHRGSAIRGDLHPPPLPIPEHWGSPGSAPSIPRGSPKERGIPCDPGEGTGISSPSARDPCGPRGSASPRPPGSRDLPRSSPPLPRHLPAELWTGWDLSPGPWVTSPTRVSRRDLFRAHGDPWDPEPLILDPTLRDPAPSLTPPGERIPTPLAERGGLTSAASLTGSSQAWGNHADPPPSEADPGTSGVPRRPPAPAPVGGRDGAASHEGQPPGDTG